ncbi:MAG: alpha-mannosidase [Clostridia bacterium]|nr:alpha-mannosidase [Clostridia bacterium]
MKPENAHFKPLDYYRANDCKTLDDVLDFGRCLEDTAFPVLTAYHGWEGSQDEPLPTMDKWESFPVFDPTAKGENNIKTGWMGAKLGLPYIAKFFDKKQYGNYGFTYYTELDLDIYCDEHPVELYSYMGGHFDLGAAPDGKDHYAVIRVDTPNSRPISDIASRYYLIGLKETNDKIADLAHSLRAGCHLLSTSNRRENLYVQGEVPIHKSKLTDEERKSLAECLVDTANYVIAALRDDTILAKLDTALKMLAPVAAYAKRFTLYFIGHSHIDLAWKWRYPETLECMKGTIETQLGLMERKPTYVYCETSAVLWRDMKAKFPEFWKRVRAAADRGQFEPQGGMWCETDGQCVGEESWCRQLEFGEKASLETVGKKATCGVNIDAFGFNAGLPKILKNAGLNYFVTQKMRYNEYNLFPYIHFWWEGDDGSRVLTLHEYPGHSNHIEIDELAKIVRVHHLTDGFYHIPILWGYGNHGGGPQPVMMDRLDELKKQTVFPNIKFCGLTEWYKVLTSTEDLSTLPTVKGELYLETHQKTYTVQAKTKQLNRECERALLNAESLQAATGEYRDLTEAWEKELFAQFHDILAGTSMLKVYLDLYEDFDRAFSVIAAADEDCAEKALGTGDTVYVFNPLSVSRNEPVIIDKAPEKEAGYVVDSNGKKHLYQKTADGKTAVYYDGLKPYSFNKLTFTDGEPAAKVSVQGTTVENGVLKVVFDKEAGAITSLVYDGKEFSGGKIGNFKVLEDTRSRDYDSWNFGFTGKEWDVKCFDFEVVEAGPVRAVIRAKYSFGIWTEKKPYFGTYLWHTPAVDYPTSFLTQDFIIYAGDPMIRCSLFADWWENCKDLKLSAETAVIAPRAFYKVPFGRLERPVKRDTSYEKARFEVAAITYADLVGEDGYGFALLNRTKHGYDTLDSRVRLTLLTSPYGSDFAKVPDSTADRGKHTIEYAFLPHKTEDDIEDIAMCYERGSMVLTGGDAPVVPLGKTLLDASDDKTTITSVRLLADGKRFYRTLGKDGKLGKIIK